MNDNDSSLTIRNVPPGDRDALKTIHETLRGAGLPLPSENETPVAFLVAERNGSITGCAGWESYAPLALVRSVAIVESRRGCGEGALLIRRLLEVLEERGYKEIFLVTIDADPFFSRFGFERIDRESLPGQIRNSPEFRMHCCESGKWMRRPMASRSSP